MYVTSFSEILSHVWILSVSFCVTDVKSKGRGKKEMASKYLLCGRNFVYVTSLVSNSNPVMEGLSLREEGRKCQVAKSGFRLRCVPHAHILTIPC